MLKWHYRQAFLAWSALGKRLIHPTMLVNFHHCQYRRIWRSFGDVTGWAMPGYDLQRREENHATQDHWRGGRPNGDLFTEARNQSIGAGALSSYGRSIVQYASAGAALGGSCERSSRLGSGLQWL